MCFPGGLDSSQSKFASRVSSGAPPPPWGGLRQTRKIFFYEPVQNVGIFLAPKHDKNVGGFFLIFGISALGTKFATKVQNPISTSTRSAVWNFYPVRGTPWCSSAASRISQPVDHPHKVLRQTPGQPPIHNTFVTLEPFSLCTGLAKASTPCSCPYLPAQTRGRPRPVLR